MAVIGSSHCDRPTLLEYIRTAVTVLSLLTLDFKTNILHWKGSWKVILLHDAMDTRCTTILSCP